MKIIFLAVTFYRRLQSMKNGKFPLCQTHQLDLAIHHGPPSSMNNETLMLPNWWISTAKAGLSLPLTFSASSLFVFWLCKIHDSLPSDDVFFHDTAIVYSELLRQSNQVIYITTIRHVLSELILSLLINGCQSRRVSTDALLIFMEWHEVASCMEHWRTSCFQFWSPYFAHLEPHPRSSSLCSTYRVLQPLHTRMMRCRPTLERLDLIPFIFVPLQGPNQYTFLGVLDKTKVCEDRESRSSVCARILDFARQNPGSKQPREVRFPSC